MKKKIKVAITEFQPLIIIDGDRYRGFEIELWESIAEIIGVEFEYEEHAFKDIIPLLVSKKVDVGLSGITIREKREKIIDFSHPTLDSGLLITVKRNRNKPSFLKSFKRFFSEGYKIFTVAFFGLSALLVLAGNFLWFLEKNSTAFNKNYFPGVFEALWFTVVSVTTVGYGDFIPQTWLGRVFTSIIIIFGAITFSFIMAEFSAFLAVKKVRGEINNSRDLFGKKVATVGGATSVDVLRKIGAKVIEVLSVEEAYLQLENENADAVIFDAPAAVYFEKNDKTNNLEIIGEIFDKQQYGIALQQGSGLRKKINQAILNMEESGEYDLIYKKWFGDDIIMEM